MFCDIKNMVWYHCVYVSQKRFGVVPLRIHDALVLLRVAQPCPGHPAPTRKKTCDCPRYLHIGGGFGKGGKWSEFVLQRGTNKTTAKICWGFGMRGSILRIYCVGNAWMHKCIKQQRYLRRNTMRFASIML